MTQLTVFGTIAAAMVAWALSEWRHSRGLWTIGAGLMVIHSLSAFGAFYGWSQDAAVAATARQTAAVTGLSWDGGVYVNYMFLAVWGADAAWWWMNPRSYLTRSIAIDAAVRGFLWFMFLNGAVIFADGGMRVLGAVVVALVPVAWYRRGRLRR